MNNPIAWFASMLMLFTFIAIVTTRNPVPWPLAAVLAFVAFGLFLNGALGNPTLADIVALFRGGKS